MPIVEKNESFISSEIPNSVKNTKTHSSTFDENEHMKKKSEMNDIPLSFASFYYSLKVLKGKDEREDVQKKTFAKWINSRLLKTKIRPVRDLFYDLRDGTVLIKLLEILTGRELKKEMGRMKVHYLGNVNIVLTTLRENKIRITNINANDIVDGNPKLTLGLVWNIIQHWQVRDILRTTVYDIHTTNLEKALLTWCQESTKDYYDVNIKDFTNSWKNGLAFNALIHKHRPNLVNFDELLEKRDEFHSNMKYAEFTLENAFDIAQKHLQIERLLDIEDVITDYPDKKSVMMYVMCFFQVLSKPQQENSESSIAPELIKLAKLKSDKATLTQSFSDTIIDTKSPEILDNKNDIVNDLALEKRQEAEKPLDLNEALNNTNENTLLDDISSTNPQKEMASISVSSSSSTSASSPVLENYLLDLKKVIEWLVNSEQLLTNQSEIGEDVNKVKAQFQTHEDFMLELTKHQNNVGLVLQEGSRLINSNSITTEEDTELRKQMKLLNDMWENLRLQAVERQAKLHERLMKLQTEQLNQMDIWLTNAENRIEKINQLADSFEGLNEQKEELSHLQDDLVKEQEAVDCLKQIIVVVDDNTDDQAFTDLENKLSSLSDRWSNVCKFVGNRWFTVQDLIIKLQSIDTDFNDLNSWITNKSVQLNILIQQTKPLVNKNKINVVDKFSDEEVDTESKFYQEYSNMNFTSSMHLIKILKEIELEMQAMHAKLNDMNEIGEQIGTQLNNSPQLSNSINNKMDTLESQWNALLEKMEYLSKVCTEQQHIELNQTSKSRNHHFLQPIDEHSVSVRADEKEIIESNQNILTENEIRKFTNIDEFVRRINRVINNVNNVEVTDDTNSDEQMDLVQKAQAELKNNQQEIDNMQLVANHLIEKMKSVEENFSELESVVKATLKKWNETQNYIFELAHTTERNFITRKALDELATLSDVHEGYQRYINTSEPLSNDDQKLSLQLETNKVKLKGMNSYENRLNDLKQLTKETDDKELINEIEKFALKWSDTYLLINRRNEEILNYQQKKSSTKTENKLIKQNKFRSDESADMLSNIYTAGGLSSTKNKHLSHYATSTTTAQSETISTKTTGTDPDSENSDDDILHVVTNVYTIPIVKSTSAGNGPFVTGSNQNINITTSCDQDFLKNDKTNLNLLTSSNSVPVVLNTPVTYKKVQNSSEVASHQDLNLENKSKFQIRSIVEIYENPIEEQEQDKCTFKNSGHFEETTTKEVINDMTDNRQNSIGLKELTSQPSESYMESKRIIIEWLNQIENSLTADDCQVTFLSKLEDRLQAFKEIQNEIREKSSNIDFLQQNAEEIATNSTVELNFQIKSDLKLLKSRYQNLIDSVTDRCDKLEIIINDLKEFEDGYARLLQFLNKIEAHSQIEHHGSTQFGLSHGKSIEAELDNLKQIKYDLDNLHTGMVKINEESGKYLQDSNRTNIKFRNKINDDVILINEKFKLLNRNYSKSLAYLEEAHKKSTKVDNEIDALDHWITMKDHEVPDDEGIIINEEQFDQRIVKYKQLKSEIEHRDSEVKRIIDTGNEMLKNSSGGVSSVADLARCLIDINNKWGNLNKKVDAKNMLYDQLSAYVNELRQLLHEEKHWLEKLEKKLNSQKIGADAEELSEELDNIETFIKSHSPHSKERINELSVLLIEKQILIQLANSDTKEFLFRWQFIHDEANRKVQSLDMAINDVQNWERRLLELKDWVNYMDKYLSTRIDQDIFSEDVPEDFTRINEEFVHNEYLLKDLEDGVEKYKNQGKLDAATRLDQQMDIMRKNWTELNRKFKKFQKPADFDQKLNKIEKLLEEIDQALYMIEVNTEDSETIHLQLEHCMKFYKTLSELKSQIEFVLKQGRSIVDKKQIDNTEQLTKQLDALKQKYNDLGSKVTNGKGELEKAFKVSKKFRKEYNVINDFMGKIDGELRKIEQKPLSKNYSDELEWIKNTKTEINKVQTINLETMNTLRRALEDLIKVSPKSASFNRTSETTAKIQEIEQKVESMQQRIDDRADFLHDEANKLEDNFHNFLETSRQVLLQIDKLQHQLIEAERNDSRELFDLIEREVNLILSDVELVRVQGTDLCSKSEQYSKTVETELRNLLTNFEDLNRKLNAAQEYGNQEIVTRTETNRKYGEESKYIRRHAKSPSESSVDSTVDVFDSELRQKYMRAVAYLRILDEAPIMEHETDGYRCDRNSDAVDIDFVIQQARQVAHLNENTNPERAKRILEKVDKLEQRWCVTKNKRDCVRSSTHVFKNHQMRGDNIHDQINIVEEKLTTYKPETSDDLETTHFYGPSDFVYEQEPEYMHQTCIQGRNFLRINDNYDVRSIISEPVIQCPLIQAPMIQQTEPLTFIRKYVTTKTTTTGIPPPMIQEQMLNNTQMASSCSQLHKDQYLMQPINSSQTRYRCASSQQQSNNGYQAQQGFRSASIPPPQKFNFDDSNRAGTTSRYYSSSTTTDHQRPQPIIRETRNSSQQYNSSGYSHGTFPHQKNIQTLPVNFNQHQMNKINSSNNDHMSGYNSCIDYSNTHYNSDWKMRHGDGIEKNIIKPVPQTIPIHQQ